MYDYERLEQYALKISTKIGFQPKIGLVLGTGLGELAEKITVVYEVPFTSLSGFPVSTVEGHIGHFLFGYLEDVPIVCMQGRVHYYEGYSMEDVVLPIRFMAHKRCGRYQPRVQRGRYYGDNRPHCDICAQSAYRKEH